MNIKIKNYILTKIDLTRPTKIGKNTVTTLDIEMGISKPLEFKKNVSLLKVDLKCFSEEKKSLYNGILEYRLEFDLLDKNLDLNSIADDELIEKIFNTAKDNLIGRINYFLKEAKLPKLINEK